MYYYIYQITNLVNNKIYVGVHKTKDLNDGYMGSGKVIKDAINKYGINNFKKDILETFENADAMYAREKEIVTDEFLLREDVYNLRRGGTGGWDYINKNNLNGFSDKDIAIKGAIAANKIRTKYHHDKFNSDVEYKNKFLLALSNSKIEFYKNGGINPMKGKTHSSETREKLRVSQTGVKNSQYGTCWVWHELIGNKKINKELLPLYIDQGWYKGRRIS